jgi:hypothetical protein
VAPRVLAPRRAHLHRRWLGQWWSAPAQAGSDDCLDGSAACAWLQAFGSIVCSSGATLLLASSELLGCCGCFFTGSVTVPEGAPKSFVRFPYFCEREGFCDGIPDGGVSDGWWVAGSLALRPAVPDLCSTLALRMMAADGRSSKLCLGAVPGR